MMTLDNKIRFYENKFTKDGNKYMRSVCVFFIVFFVSEFTEPYFVVVIKHVRTEYIQSKSKA